MLLAIAIISLSILFCKKPIKSVAINPERGAALQQKATELIIKSKTAVKESEIVSFMIDNMLDLIDMDDLGMLIVVNEEHRTVKIESVNRKIKRGKR